MPVPRVLVGRAIRARKVFIAEAAMLTLAWSDPMMWGERDVSGFLSKPDTPFGSIPNTPSGVFEHP